MGSRERRASSRARTSRSSPGRTAPCGGALDYDLLRRHRKALGAIEWAGLSIDEAHHIKNDSARTKHLLRLAGLGDGSHEPEAV